MNRETLSYEKIKCRENIFCRYSKKKCLSEALLMSTHNICFPGEIRSRALVFLTIIYILTQTFSQIM